MGCVSSKNATIESSKLDASSSASTAAGRRNGSGHRLPTLSSLRAFGLPLEKIKEEPEEEKEGESVKKRRSDVEYSGNLRALKRGASQKKAVFSFKFGRLTESEHVSAGWPPWLSAVAGEAIEGWLPLRSDAFEKLDKIGQGTYSNVYRARDVKTGKMVALKKVRFDNFQPESVRFMAREITILRKLDHPNIMKLEGIITSRLSCNIYLVFEYMEHDLSGLLSCPDIKFSDSQIKCYMRQLLCGLEHCHLRGIMHRDIKASNILVNNEGRLKIADFGLASFMRVKNKQPLTSRVVTLWYRPPELLLGSTNYGESVDVWSVGCVFAELFIGRPLLKGRTEVEQLHKIFKLCGSPPDDYWKRSKLPLATMFKPQQPYESTLRERCKEFPKSAVNLIEKFLSIEPYSRGTASSALESEYFTTKPYACDPSSLPKYPPNKEIDAKFREEVRRRKVTAVSMKYPRRVRKTHQDPTSFGTVIPSEVVEANIQVGRRHHGGGSHLYKGGRATVSRMSAKEYYDTVSEASQMTEESQADSVKTVPVQITASSGFAWAKKRKQEAGMTRLGYRTSRSHNLGTNLARSNLTLDDLLRTPNM
ncbi:probable serine threonine- kinase At1g54610 [Olea europaea subsp. europaea]|uniref:Probable serine threonine- kinase At1g54610 n=1 Tax=Olea europaea subsp. europaea TaxID=158383 RepID=A0A8S0VDH8_OLEEU|nr:probable serine threonine- kinase At1g54610 [Olea europaea subsp. europaea]